MSIVIRAAEPEDFEQIWPVLQLIARQGETYALPPDLSRSEAESWWMAQPNATLVAESEGQILGSYYIKTNHPGPGAHVCNCGYIVAPAARGRGLATMMCQDSQERAIGLGFIAMQFNFVASTNEGAIRLWRRLGFEEVGRLPKAFRHPRAGLVDALLMYKWLQSAAAG